jgi:glycerol kinase
LRRNRNMPSLYLALDQGGHASRALVFDAGGAVVRSASIPIATQRNDEGHVEHDPEELVASLRQAIDAACTELPPGSQLLAAGLATQRSSMACWHRQTGLALSPVISWQDRRNAAWLERLGPEAGRIRALTGLVLTPHYGASKMRWCLDNLPAIRAAEAEGNLVMGPLASFLTCRLLEGRPLLADPANASRTQLWALATRDWSPELLALFGIAREVLPRAVPSRYAYGVLPTPAGPVPLTVVTGDQSAVPFAFGPLDPGIAYVNLGTGAFAQRAVSGTLPVAPRLLVSVVWSTASHVDYLLEGTVNGAGSALDWLADREGAPLPLLLAEAEAALAAGEAPPLFINGVSGLGAPFWVSKLESRFVGAGTRGARTLAVLESIAFLLQVNLEELEAHGPPLTGLLVTGGLSANEYLCACLAGLSGLPVRRAEDPESTARGLARLVAGDDGKGWRLLAFGLRPAMPDGALRLRYLTWRAEVDAAIAALGAA